MVKATREKNSSKEKKRGKFLPFVLICAIIVFVVLFIVTISDAKNVIPNRDAAIEQGFVADEDKLYVLLVGSDQNPAVSTTARADTIIVASIDLIENSVFLLSIPRDSYVEIKGYGEDKINHAYAFGGIELLQDAVEQLLNVPIDYYAVVDFNGFEDIIDALGGVEIDVDKRMYYHTYDALIDIEAGLQRLNGEQALQYVRYRADQLGDITRVSRQQLLLKAIMTEFSENGGVGTLAQALPAVLKAVETDMGFVDMLRLGLFARNLSGDSLNSSTLPGGFMDKNHISYWRVDHDELQQLVEEHFGGSS